MSHQLSASEWDFGNVPEGELTACCYYEFGREVLKVRARIEELRGITAVDQYEEFLEATSGFYKGGCQFFLWYPEWPGTPYLKIDKTTRERRIGFLKRELSDAELADRLRPIPPPIYLPESPIAAAINSLRQGDPTDKAPPTKVNLDSLNQSRVEIVIRPWFTHDQLKEAFAALLRQDFRLQGKRAGRRFKAQGGTGGLRPKKQALKALGVYRLLKNQTAFEVLEFFESID